MGIMEYIQECIKMKRYTLLPESIAIGKVYKIKGVGNLERDGFETGFLYLPKGSGIKEHQHVSDAERYKLILGNISINGENTNINICNIGEKHSIDIVNEDTVVETCKVSKKYIEEEVKVTNTDFESIVINRSL